MASDRVTLRDVTCALERRLNAPAMDAIAAELHRRLQQPRQEEPMSFPFPLLPRIRTRCEYPPIPDRRFDYLAYYDGEEDEHCDTGWGRTEAEAVADLIENYPRGVQCVRELPAHVKCTVCGTDKIPVLALCDPRRCVSPNCPLNPALNSNGA